MKNKKFIQFLILLIVALSGQPGNVFANNNDKIIPTKQKTLAACNAAPYSNEIIILNLSGQKIKQLALPAGNCDDFEVNIPQNGAFIYSRAASSPAFIRLKKYNFFSNAWQGRPVFTPKNSNKLACLNRSTGTLQRFKGVFKCEKSERSIQLGFLNGNAKKYKLFIEDPFLCNKIKPSCKETKTLELLSWAHSLERSLTISLRVWTEAHRVYGLIPTASGMETTDQNGPFMRGILITEQQANRTPLGSPVPGDRGDIIVSFNGEPIYDRDDYIMLAIEHGETKGYENPYTIELIRGSRRFVTEGYLVFHRQIYGSFFLNNDGSCKNKTATILSSSLLEATFYAKPILACIHYNTQHQHFSRRRECEFSVRQLTAAYRQFCPSFTQASAIVGSLFLPGRATAETVVRKLAVRKVSRVAPALIVEAAEELARAIITLPPGIRVENNWGSIGQQIGFGMAVGTGVRLITLK